MSFAALNALFKEFEAEDRAVSFMWDMPPHTAASVAVTATQLEIQRWETEKSEMLKRDDPRPVYKIGSRHTDFLDLNSSPVRISDIRAVAYLLSIFAGLPADAAALAAYDAAKWA